ncbi:MAG: hypothetical protein ACKO7W_17905 [Elainella sp.]
MIDRELIQSLKLAAETSKAVAESCQNLIEQMQQAQSEQQWMALDDAAAALGPGISPEMLKERCTDGRFTYGVHFINTSDGKRGNYLIKVAAVRKFFETDPAKRPPLRRVV